MNGWTNISALLTEPEALRGLDRLIEYARSVVDRYMRVPARNADHESLARVA